MLKQLTLAAAIASALTTTLATAETFSTGAGEIDVSVTAGLYSDYIWRGVSQTKNDPALQGSLDVSHESGLYAGVWASNVDFGGDETVEVDYFAGFGGDLTDDVAYDLGYNYYSYPGESGLNFGEYYGSLSGWGLTLGANYANDFYGDSTLYTYVGYERELPLELTLALQYGNYDYKDDLFLSGDDSYNDWSVGLSRSFLGLDFGLTYTDTSLSDGDCADFAGKKGYCDANVVLSVSKTL